MNPAVEAIAQAVLYEGYILYPYRATAAKNRHRWTLGGILPHAYSEANGGSEPWFFQTECLVECDERAVLSVHVRFLHALLQTVDSPSLPSQEATEREVPITDFPLIAPSSIPQSIPFSFPGSRTTDSNRERIQHMIEGKVDISATRVEKNVFKLTVRVQNNTPIDLETITDRRQIELRSLASAHAILGIHNGQFVSLIDYPDHLRVHTAGCCNIGVWPVLVGKPGARDTVLASPIILPDYPLVAPESTGDFYDGTEIDEMLALRVLTLTDAEKREMASDPHSRAILERVELLSPAGLAGLHGAVRSNGSPTKLATGSRVRLHPRRRADAFDLLLAGKIATIVSVEIDFEGKVYYAVAVDDDPGQDLGRSAQPGHRFFFRFDEVELFTVEERA